MADNPSNGNFTNYGIIFATLLSAGALLFPGFPALNTRPQSAEPPVHETASSQDTDARLWQDPFEVVARAVKDPHNPAPCASVKADRHCERPIDQLLKDKSLKQGENPVYIGVTLSGAPYPEDEEARRQYRYAVVSGLDVVGYVPHNPQGIGYFRLNSAEDASSEAVPLPTAIPFELFETQTTETEKRKIVLLWLNEDLAAGRPLLHFCSLLKKLHLETRGMQVIGPRSSDTLRDLVKEAKEPGQNTYGAPADCEYAFKGLQQSKFYSFSATVEDRALLSASEFSRFKSVHAFLETKNIHLFRTVATDDVVANSLVRELKLRGVEPGLEQWKHATPQSERIRKSPPNQQHIALISEWDTFYGQTFPKTLQESLQTSLSGCAVAAASCAKAKEPPLWLHKFTYLRGLDGALPRNQQDAPQKSAPGDEQSGSDKNQADKNRTDANTSDLPFGNGQFDYLRRLADNIRSLQDELRQTDQGEIKAIGVLGTDVFDKLQVLRALKFEFPEAIFFTIDFDEAFRMEKYRKATRNLIIASSYGSELRRPLQGAIPPFRQSYQTAAFLSTQLAVMDAQFRESFNPPAATTDEDPTHYTRLVSAVVNSLNENAEALPRAQAAEPATVSDPPPPDCPEGDEQKCLDKWLKQPPIFEIERSGNPLQLSQHAPQEADPCDGPQNLRICKDILPSGPPLFPSPDFRVRLGLVIILGGAFLYAFQLAGRYRATLKILKQKSHLHQDPPRLTFADATYWIYTLAFGLIASLGVFLLILGLQWQWFAPWLTSYGEGEPMQLFEGASLWPSIGLRLVTMILSVSFIFLAWGQLEANINITARLIRQKKTPRMVINEINRCSNIKMLNLFEKIRNCFYINKDIIIRSINSDVKLKKQSNNVFVIDYSWSAYVYSGRPFARFCRVVACVSAMFVIASLLFAISRSPGNPGRGELVRNLYFWFTIIDVLLMYFLIFLVADATLFSFLFVRQLAKRPTVWPVATKKFFNRKLGLDLSFPTAETSKKSRSGIGAASASDHPSAPSENHHHVLDDWIDLYFISKRTACINRLIYYPFAVIALMIVSRSAVFGDFPLSKPIIITWGVCLTIVVGCAIALNHVAENARDLAQRHLMDEIIKAKGVPESGRTSQWESILDRVNAMRDGAFRPFLQQPVFGAMLLPLSSVGWSTLLEKGLLGQ